MEFTSYDVFCVNVQNAVKRHCDKEVNVPFFCLNSYGFLSSCRNFVFPLALC